MIFRTERRGLFVGFIPSLRRPIWMNARAARAAMRGESVFMPFLRFQWDDDREAIVIGERGEHVLLGGWSIYFDLIAFALSEIYRRGTENQRARYAIDLANQLMNGAAWHRPDDNELNGILRAHLQLKAQHGEQAHFQGWGERIVAAATATPTIIVQ